MENGNRSCNLHLDNSGRNTNFQKNGFCSQSKVTEMAGRGPAAEEDAAVGKLKEKETWYPAAPESEQ